MTWTSAQVAEALGVSAPAHLRFTGITTDSRHPIADSLFVALKGERFDAHDFLAQAKAAGATGAVALRESGEAGGARVRNGGHARLEGCGSGGRLRQEEAPLRGGAPGAVVGNSPTLVAEARRRAKKVVVVARDEFGEVHPDKVDVDD